MCLTATSLAAAPARGEAAAGPALEGIPVALPGAEPFAPPLRAALARALAARAADAPPRTRHLRADGTPRFTNRLLLESSPYLQQHAHNPVDWRPWGEEAFADARRLGRPVLVSIGYATCHWCHVMEEESYDDPELAAFLNAHFVAIKVDREVRPDVDAVYMAAVQSMTGHGGWPLNVFLTPDRRPFYGGTYFPHRDDPASRRPGFRTVLQAIADRYTNEPERIEAVAARITGALQQALAGAAVDATRLPGPEALRAARQSVAERFDPQWGGTGRAPKFPARTPVRLLLRLRHRLGDREAGRMAELTLERMAAGGIHDQIGGGFHRYSTDREWRVPHFEKMLYDNALLTVAYLEAWQASGRDEFADVVRDTVGFLLRDMRTPEGGFVSALDADSPGPDGRPHEGWSYTWTPSEVRTVLDPRAAEVALRVFGVDGRGRVAGRSVLRRAHPMEAVAIDLGIAPEAARRRLERARHGLLAVRSRRPQPARDEKVLAGWNGLAVSALARAGFALDEPAWVDAARTTAALVLERMRPDGRLRRVLAAGRAEGTAFLEDGAFLVAGLLDLYEATGEARWLDAARSVQAELDAHYWDGTAGGYFRTPDDGEKLLVREKPDQDGALPSGNSVAALSLLRLAGLTQDPRVLERAGALQAAFAPALAEHPGSLTEMLLAVDMRLDTPREIVVVAPPDAPGAEALLAPVRTRFVPNRVLVRVAAAATPESLAARVPIAESKIARNGRPTAYVCERRVCEAPTTDPAELARQLGAAGRAQP